MPGKHTVEKIGGTSMSQFGDVMKNVIIGNRTKAALYNRIFVVSAYGGITNLLLEDKKTGDAGVYGIFAKGGKEWEAALERVREAMIKFNRSFENIGLCQEDADNFINERLDGIKVCLKDLARLRTFGHFTPKEYLPATREFLSAVGEAHSAYNSVQILKSNGINAVFTDLSGWKESDACSIEQTIMRNLENIDFSSSMPIVTGYAKCEEGIMNRFDRGYSEITFSKIAVLTDAAEGIIHKEFHLSTGDPKLIGVNNVRIIGNTNFDIADQLADMSMEAIHPKASKEMELKNIHIRVKNVFDPENPGTLISKDYVSPEPRVEMICGLKDIVAIEVFDPEMVGQSGYDFKLVESLAKFKISYIAKNTNANTITHYVSKKAKDLTACIDNITSRFPGATITSRDVAIVSVIGSNMKIPGFLSRAAGVLARANINILALDQCMRQVNMQFIIDQANFNEAQQVLHKEFVE
jgi:aspartate kinase